jgi:hypothetical protein
MFEKTDRPTIEESYINAGNSSDLTVEADALKLVLDLYEQDGSAQADNEFEQGFGGPEAQAAGKQPMAAQLGSYKGGAQ